MFSTHQKQIQAFSEQSPENTARVIKFVLVSIQRNLSCVEGIMTGEKPVKDMTKLTKEGIRYAEENALELHALIHGIGSTRDKLLGVCCVPGLGIVKSGFVLQLCLGIVGCLDTHNLRNFKLDAKDFRLSKSLASNARKATVYIECCEKLGGCGFLWDQWCEFIATRHAKLWENADDVSSAHVRGIIF